MTQNTLMQTVHCIVKIRKWENVGKITSHLWEYLSSHWPHFATGCLRNVSQWSKRRPSYDPSSSQTIPCVIVCFGDWGNYRSQNWWGPWLICMGPYSWDRRGRNTLFNCMLSTLFKIHHFQEKEQEDFQQEDLEENQMLRLRRRRYIAHLFVFSFIQSSSPSDARWGGGGWMQQTIC